MSATIPRLLEAIAPIEVGDRVVWAECYPEATLELRGVVVRRNSPYAFGPSHCTKSNGVWHWAWRLSIANVTGNDHLADGQRGVHDQVNGLEFFKWDCEVERDG